jgi:uncharacterized protein YlxP (DUF503 family)
VGVLELTLELAGNHSLKAKRKVISSLMGRVKARFNVATAEVGAQDRHDLAVLGFTVCGSEAKILNSVLDHLRNFIEDNAEAEVVDIMMDCQVWDESETWGERLDDPASLDHGGLNEPETPGKG